MGKNKRVNPRRIPMPKGSFDLDAIINEASLGNLYYAWLLVLHAILEYDAETPEEKQRFLDAANRTVMLMCRKEATPNRVKTAIPAIP